MENNKNFAENEGAVENVIENPAENVEQTTKESPKMYTEEEFNAKVNEIVGKRTARKEAKIRREYESKYGELTDVLSAGTGKKDVGEITDTFKNFYETKGIKLPSRPNYNDSDLAVLAKADAEDIINAGFDEVVEETDRLASIGAANMTPRERAVFKTLAEHRQAAERSKELASIGVTEDVYGSEDFKKFAANFKADIPIKDVFDIYRKTQPQKNFATMGSMKNSTGDNGTVKDFYTRDEALKFTKKDFDKNPALFKAVEASMLKW